MSINLGRQLGVMQEGDYYQLPFGKFVFVGNEVFVITDNADTPAFSLIGFTGGKLSWKTASGDEKVLEQLRQNTKGDGEFYFGCFSQAVYEWLVAAGNPKALDGAMLELFTINPDGVEFRVPVKASAGIVGASAATILTSTNGRYLTQQQDDGNLVTYDTSVVPWRALWSSLTGPL